MLAGLLDHHKAELPHYKRIAKNRLIKIKDSYFDHFKERPEDFVMATLVGASVGLAWYYRQRAKMISNGSWVELLPEWENAMLDRGAVLGMVIDGGQLRAKIFEREETKY